MSRIYSYLKQILFYLILIIYILLLAKILLFKYVSPSELFSADRVVTRNFNLVPFKTVFGYLSSDNSWITLMNVIGNIIIFIPLGTYLQMFKRNKKILNCVTLICVISLCVEVTQYILGIGAADIDDIILNTIGGLLGVFIYRIVYLVLKDENKTRTAITFLFFIAGVSFLVFINLLKLSGLKIKFF